LKSERFSELGIFNWEMMTGSTRIVPSIEKFGPGQLVLDAGCGLGGITISIALADHQVSAVDINSERVQKASRYSRQHRLNNDFVVADVLSLPFRSCVFHFVVLCEVVEHVRSCLACLRECHRVLRVGGAAYVSFPPYYGPFGGHLRTHILFPYAHYLPKTVVRILIRRKGDIGILTARHLTRLFESLNKLTIFRFESFARATGFALHPIQEGRHKELWRFTARSFPAGLRDLIAIWYSSLLIKK